MSNVVEIFNPAVGVRDLATEMYACSDNIEKMVVLVEYEDGFKCCHHVGVPVSGAQDMARDYIEWSEK